MQQFFSLLSWHLFTAQHVLGVADVRHFGHHTVWQVYLTLDTREVRTVAYLLWVRADNVRNFAIVITQNRLWQKLYRASWLKQQSLWLVFVWCLVHIFGATLNIWHCYSWFAIVAPGKWQYRLFEFCQDCLFHIHSNSTVIWVMRL
jgi:hypothetical protein